MSLTAQRLLIITVLIVAAGLRLWGLERNPLWNDELFSWHIGSFPTFPEVISEGVRPDVHPPLYFLLLQLVIRFIGESEAVLRLPSAIAGVAAVWMIYRLGVRLYSGKEALIAAAMLAVSWPGVYYAQTARPYSLLLLAVICATYFWIGLLRSFERGDRPETIAIAGYLLSALIAAYLHYFGLQIIFLQGICAGLLFIWNRTAILTCLAIYGALALTYLPWVPSMLEQLTGHPNFWIGKPAFFSSVRWQVFAAFHFPIWLSGALVVPAVLLAVIAGGRVIKPQPLRTKLLSSDAIIIGWCALPFLAAYIQSVVSTPVMTARNLTVILPAIYLLTARGICMAKHPWVTNVWAATLIVTIAMQLKPYLTEIQNQRFDLVAAYVIEQTKKPIPVVAFTERQDFFDYYFRKLGSPLRVGLRATAPYQVVRFVADREKFWLISGPTPPSSEMKEHLNKHYMRVKYFTPYGASASLYKAR